MSIVADKGDYIIMRAISVNRGQLPIFGMLICFIMLSGVARLAAQIDYFLPETEDFFGLWLSDSDWGDFDNDNDLDLLMVGYGLGGQTGEGFMRFYQNHGNSTFSLYPNAMNGAGNGTAKFADLDGDNDLDALICGQTLFGVDTTRVYTNTAGVFSDCGYPFPPRVASSASFGDFDNDGDLDILLTGGTIDDASDGYTEIYRNDGNFNFTLYTQIVPGVRNGDACLGDYNGDGWLDFALTGRAGSGDYITKLFKGNSIGVFTEVAAGFYGLRYSKVSFVDYDCDGDLDVMVTGSFVNESPSVFKLYRNNGNDQWEDIAQPAVLGARQGDLVWGDINSDGYPDIILNGLITNSSTVANVYLYAPGSGLYVDSQQMIYLKYAAMCLGDYNNDNKLDLSLSGHYEYQNYWNDLYYNAYTASNTAPTAPVNLNEVVLEGSALLAWDPATDTQTPAAGLTYNVRMGTTPGGNDVISSMAVSSTGWRKLARQGNAYHRNFYQIDNLADDTYYWSVQTIDNSFAGSAFAVERSFTLGVANNDNVMPAITGISTYPNPASPSTNIRISLQKAEKVNAAIYNIKGQLVRTISDAELGSGTHHLDWNGCDSADKPVASGIYTLRLSAGKQTQNHKLTLINKE